MHNVTLQDLERDPAALLDRVEAGERLIVSRGGRPVAELRPVGSPRSVPPTFGLTAGAFVVPEDFDCPLPEDVVNGFERA
jgi:prevent-host-death family protein